LATTTVDLAPEKSINYEIGARWDLLPGLTLSTAIFRLDKEDVRVADPANPGFFVKTDSSAPTASRSDCRGT